MRIICNATNSYLKLSWTSCVTITAKQRVVPTTFREFPSTRAPRAYESLVAKVTNASSVTNKNNSNKNPVNSQNNVPINTLSTSLTNKTGTKA